MLKSSIIVKVESNTIHSVIQNAKQTKVWAPRNVIDHNDNAAFILIYLFIYLVITIQKRSTPLDFLIPYFYHSILAF